MCPRLLILYSIESDGGWFHVGKKKGFNLVNLGREGMGRVLTVGSRETKCPQGAYRLHLPPVGTDALYVHKSFAVRIYVGRLDLIK